MAQIAYWVYLLQWTVQNMFSKHPKRPTADLKEFLLNFDRRTGEAAEPEVVRKRRLDEERDAEQVMEEKLKVSKGAWGCFMKGSVKPKG